MQRHGAMSWYATWPLATALTAALVMGVVALLETTLMVGPEAQPRRPAPQPTRPLAPQRVTIEPSRAPAARLRQPASRDAGPGRCRAPVRSAGRLATRPSVPG